MHILFQFIEWDDDSSQKLPLCLMQRLIPMGNANQHIQEKLEQNEQLSIPRGAC